MDTKLKKALEAQLMDSYNDIMNSDIPDYSFSPEFEKKMAEIVSETDCRNGSGISKTIIRCTTFVAAAAAVIGVWGGISARKDIIDQHYPDIDITVMATTVTASEDIATTVPFTQNASLINETRTAAVSSVRSSLVSEKSADRKEVKTSAASAKPANDPNSINDNRNETRPAAALNTAAVTNVQTSLPASSVQVNFTTTTEAESIIDERSIIMKKLTAFLAAMSIGTNLTPLPTDAADTDMNTFGYSEYYVNHQDYRPYIKALNYIDAKDINKDINNDGIYDLKDCYAFFVYNEYDNIRIDDSLAASCAAFKESLDNKANGYLDGFDLPDLFIDHFLFTHGMKADYGFVSYYENNYDSILTAHAENDAETITDVNNKMAYTVVTKEIEPPNSYTVIEDIMSNTDITIDFNSDGVFNVDDYYIYDTYLWNKMIVIGDYMSTHEDDYDPKEALSESDKYENIKLIGKEAVTEEEFELCKKFYNKYDNKEYLFESDDIENAMFAESIAGLDNILDYVLRDADVSPECFEEAYYLNIIPSFHAAVETSKLVRIYCEYHYDSSKTEMQVGDVLYSKSMYEVYTNRYLDEVEQGTMQKPDINGDGILDINDIHVLMFFELHSGEEYPGESNTFITAQEWEKLNNDFDLNRNGISGDIYDTTIGIFYIYATNDSVITNEDMDQLLEGDNYEQNMQILSKLDIERSGDANCDNETGLADALIILQNNANSQKYPLSKTGEFNADVYNTGDGVTPMDALELQKWDATKNVK
ncbi:hypothetical protein [Ruminococcus sp. XPD3002]|uniref:hypothetical protein n=1 Tax=Ruminococcus sp. XPD3002 TaxID=1452269 RepID=UPI000922EAF2|nr:hypothetical protein SAMN04487832_101246 [Ruminococcus flavefaciens]